MKEVLERAIRKNGVTHQSIVAMEELSELQKEISKAIRGADNKKEMTEEIADVVIMIEQLQIMYGIEDIDIADMMAIKIRRLKERLGGTE